MDLDKVMERISKLINQADHPNTSKVEADAFRAKAESLMRQYRIEEEQLVAQDETGITPVLKEFEVIDSMDNEFLQEYIDLFWSVAQHCGIRVHFSYRKLDGTFTGGCWVHVVGYSSDIRFTEFIYSAARLVFAANLEPSFDPSLSDAENIYRMRKAGLTRNQVAQKMWGKHTHSNAIKVSNVYKQECERRGEQPALAKDNRTNAKTYRQVYAREFVSELRYRLSRARDAADSYGGSLQLHGRQERINEVFYTAYPQYRPNTSPPPSDKDSKGSKGKRVKPYKRTKADEAKAYRMYQSPSARAGTRAGVAAAQDVQLTRSPARKDRVTGNNSTTDNLALGSE